METALSRVIVTISGTSSTSFVHHRDFPEIRAEGPSPQEAAAHLVNKLACAWIQHSPTGVGRRLTTRSRT